MKNKIFTLIIAAFFFASCSTTHKAIQQDATVSYSKKSHGNTKATAKLSAEEIQKQFLINLILLHKCDIQILDDFAYLYDVNRSYGNGFYSIYFTPFQSYFTPHKLYLSYDPSIIIRCYPVNEYVSQYANPYTPAPAGFQKNIQINNNSKYLQPVEITRGYHYVSGSNIDYATSRQLNNRSTLNNNPASQNNLYGSSSHLGNRASAYNKFENVNQSVKTYKPEYADNNNYQNNFNNNQSSGTASNNSQSDNKLSNKNMPR